MGSHSKLNSPFLLCGLDFCHLLGSILNVLVILSGFLFALLQILFCLCAPRLEFIPPLARIRCRLAQGWLRLFIMLEFGFLELDLVLLALGLEIVLHLAVTLPDRPALLDRANKRHRPPAPPR